MERSVYERFMEDIRERIRELGSDIEDTLERVPLDDDNGVHSMERVPSGDIEQPGVEDSIEMVPLGDTEQPGTEDSIEMVPLGRMDSVERVPQGDIEQPGAEDSVEIVPLGEIGKMERASRGDNLDSIELVPLGMSGLKSFSEALNRVDSILPGTEDVPAPAPDMGPSVEESPVNTPFLKPSPGRG